MSQIIPESQILWINGKDIPYAAIIENDPARLELSGDFEQETISLVRKWLTGETIFELKSSGSRSFMLSKYSIARS